MSIMLIPIFVHQSANGRGLGQSCMYIHNCDQELEYTIIQDFFDFTCVSLLFRLDTLKQDPYVRVS